MPLRFAAITPHSPILVPTIGKENWQRAEKTLNSYQKIQEGLLNTKTDVLIVISPHGSNNDKLLLNACPEIIINFEEFGDFSSKTKIKTDLTISEKIRASLLELEKIEIINRPVADFGSGVPIFLLSGEFRDLRVVCVNSSSLPIRDHFEIATIIGKELEKQKKNIAVIASCDLSHCLNKKSPGGYSPKGQKFDLRLMNLIYEKRMDDLIGLDEKNIDEASPCGINAIIMLFGILYGAGANWEMSSSTYESPFGVGFLTASLDIKKSQAQPDNIIP
jgi:aromatic ring-opening dioxygenase LigB subunit